MATPLSGPLASRRLGTASGDLRRAARQTKDRGTRSALNDAAAKVRMGEGSAVTSADSNAAEQQYAARSQAGLMEARRRAVLGNGSVAAAPSMSAADAQKSRMDFYAKRNGTAPALMDARPAANKNFGEHVAGDALRGVITSGAAGNPAAPVPTTNADGLVSAPATLSSAAAPQREGRIDGMPASLATARSQAVMAAGGPRETFGADVANKNLGAEVTNDSMRTALADYERRSAADDGIARAGRGAAYTAATAKPGEVPDPTVVGPLQAALLRSREDQAARATKEATAFKQDFAAATDSVVAINTSPMKSIPGSRDFGQRGSGGLPVPPPAAPKSTPTREPAAPWEAPNGVTWPDRGVAEAPVQSSIARSYGERSTTERGGFTDTLPGAALAATGRAVGGTATALYKAWRDQKPYDKKKGTSSIERSLATSARR